MSTNKLRTFVASVFAVAALSGCMETREAAPQLAAAAPPPAVTNNTVPLPEQKPPERPADAWTTNEEAMKIIEEAEGLRLRAYRLAGQWLIGYGHATDQPDEVAQNLTITATEAQRLLKSDIKVCEQAVRRVLNVNVTRNQFSAMVALCYNVGQTKFANSRIVRHVNQGDHAHAADAFLLYDKACMHEAKVKVASLTNRRLKERQLFRSS